MKKFLRKVLMTPGMNSLARFFVKEFAIRSSSISGRLMRYVHVSGVINILIGEQRISLWSHGDDALVSKLYYNSDWEKNVMLVFSEFCAKYRYVIDAGANIGIFSLLAAKINREAVVHAFEPNPHNFLRLSKNITLNHLDGRICGYQLALGNSSQQIDFYLPTDDRISDVSSVYRTHATSFNDFEHRKIKVSSISLDDFCVGHNVVPEIVKIDVELYELQVLQGMKSLMIAKRPVIFCEIFNDEVKRKLNPLLHNELLVGYTAKVHEFLNSVNYSPYAILTDGILRVDSLKLSPASNVYLLLPFQLKHEFYLLTEIGMVLEELNHD